MARCHFFGTRQFVSGVLVMMQTGAGRVSFLEPFLMIADLSDLRVCVCVYVCMYVCAYVFMRVHASSVCGRSHSSTAGDCAADSVCVGVGLCWLVGRCLRAFWWV